MRIETKIYGTPKIFIQQTEGYRITEENAEQDGQ
jgi:hypothetical protein